MNRLTEARKKYKFDIKYKKSSKMPADFLSQNAVNAVGIFDDNWKIDYKKMSIIKFGSNTWKRRSCFLDDGLLWRQLQSHCK